MSMWDALPLYRQPNWQAPQNVNYLSLGVGFMLVEQALEIWLTLRQRKYLHKTELPQDLVGAVTSISEDTQGKTLVPPKPQEMDRDSDNEAPATLIGQLQHKFLGSRLYNLDKNTFSMVQLGYGLVTSAAFLLSGFGAWSWTQSQQITGSMLGHEWAASEIAVGSVFLAIQSLVGIVVNLPISWASIFIVEQKHGFNKTTMKTFFGDIVKGFIVETLLTTPLLAAVTKLVRWGGDRFWIYVSFLMVVFSLAMLTIVPNFIMPLFNTFIRLPDGELRSAIEETASSQKFPLTKIYEVDGSKRSTHSNAYLFGFHKDKRIVLFDTLLRNKEEPALECDTNEIVAIVSHELGHWKLSHTLQGFVLQNFLFFCTFRGFSQFVHDKDMYASFGFTEMPVLVGLNLFMQILSPIGAVLGLALNSMTRKFEFEADDFAARLGKAESLKSALVKISLSNMSSFEVDPLFHAFHHSHPTLLMRLRALDVSAKKDK
mmetsp:Transcript_16259/g.28816  ORF Transcript_16259/g.28816 Transcript_16259/m.28816 type:complete len:486 (+) Transcript_16259:161-1618(+)